MEVALTGRADCAEDGTDQYHVQVGVFGNDDGVVAAQFEDRLAEALRATAEETMRPTRVEPVNETSGTRLSLFMRSPDDCPPVRN